MEIQYVNKTHIYSNMFVNRTNPHKFVHTETDVRAIHAHTYTRTYMYMNMFSAWVVDDKNACKCTYACACQEVRIHVCIRMCTYRCVHVRKSMCGRPSVCLAFCLSACKSMRGCWSVSQPFYLSACLYVCVCLCAFLVESAWKYM